jgi:hypothetical protein
LFLLVDRVGRQQFFDTFLLFFYREFLIVSNIIFSLISVREIKIIPVLENVDSLKEQMLGRV